MPDKEPKERKVEKSDLTSAERLFLLRDYLAKNANEENPITREKVEEYLKDHGIPRTAKTFYRDIEKLNYLGYEVCYVVNKGYYLANPTFEPYELRLMVDGIQTSKFITQKKADDIIRKIKCLTDHYTASTLNRQSYVANRTRSTNEPVVETVDIIHQCISENQKVSFKMFDYNVLKEKEYRNKGNAHIVSPFALLWDNGYYYLYGFEKNKFMFFRVDRMESIQPVPQNREGVELFRKKDMAEKQNRMFDMFQQDNPTDVTIQFHEDKADIIINRFGKNLIFRRGEEIKSKKKPTKNRKKKYYYITHINVDCSPAFYTWLASFGPTIKVLAPEEVVNGYKKNIQNILNVYNEENGEEKSISLRCVNFLSDVIINRFGKDVMMYADPNHKDHFITTVSVKESDQFYAWVASFGNKMKVVAPDEATQNMKKYIEKIYDLYKDEGKM